MIWRLFLSLAILLKTTLSFGQTKEGGFSGYVYDTEHLGYFQLRTNGWGFGYQGAKYLDVDNKRIFGLEFDVLHHAKEKKRSSNIDPNSRSYKFGKLNYVYLLKGKYGKERIVAPKRREKGVEISFKWSVSPILVFARPVYLEIFRDNRLFNEAYDPEKHHEANIIGRSSGIKGFSELKLYAGVGGGLSYIFEYSSGKESVKALEVGANLELYYQKIPIMSTVNNDFVYGSLYLRFLIGKKH